MIKYTINTFLASKVIYFNEIKRLFDSFKISDDWNEIIDIISLDERLGSSHMNVPGHDGRLGFGGACFPKDSLALLKLASKEQIELKILENVIRINNTIRKEYEELDARESEQNVSYDDKIKNAQVVKLVDTRDLKSSKETSCRFKSGPGHHICINYVHKFHTSFF